MNRTFLLTGATGYIGRKLVEKLLSDNNRLLIISRDPEKTSRLFSSDKVRCFSWKSLETEFISDTDVDVVINLAGENIGRKRWTRSYKKKLLDSRTEVTNRLIGLTARLSKPPGHWIQASAIGYYGYAPGTEADENSPKGNGFLSDLVSEWENETKPLLTSGTVLHIFRFGVVVDERSEFLEAFLKGKLFKTIICPGKGENYISWIHSEDLTSLLLNSLQYNTGKTCNAIAPNPVKTIDICKILMNQHQFKFLIRLPAIMLELALGKEKTRELVLADQQVRSVQSQVDSFNFSFRHFEDILQKDN